MQDFRKKVLFKLFGNNILNINTTAVIFEIILILLIIYHKESDSCCVITSQSSGPMLITHAHRAIYSKTCVKGPLKNRQNKDLDDKW